MSFNNLVEMNYKQPDVSGLDQKDQEKIDEQFTDYLKLLKHVNESSNHDESYKKNIFCKIVNVINTKITDTKNAIITLNEITKSANFATDFTRLKIEVKSSFKNPDPLSYLEGVRDYNAIANNISSNIFKISLDKLPLPNTDIFVNKIEKYWQIFAYLVDQLASPNIELKPLLYYDIIKKNFATSIINYKKSQGKHQGLGQGQGRGQGRGQGQRQYRGGVRGYGRGQRLDQLYHLDYGSGRELGIYIGGAGKGVKTKPASFFKQNIKGILTKRAQVVDKHIENKKSDKSNKSKDQSVGQKKDNISSLQNKFKTTFETLTKKDIHGKDIKLWELYNDKIKNIIKNDEDNIEFHYDDDFCKYGAIKVFMNAYSSTTDDALGDNKIINLTPQSDIQTNKKIALDYDLLIKIFTNENSYIYIPFFEKSYKTKEYINIQIQSKKKKVAAVPPGNVKKVKKDNLKLYESDLNSFKSNINLFAISYIESIIDTDLKDIRTDTINFLVKIYKYSVIKLEEFITNIKSQHGSFIVEELTKTKSGSNKKNDSNNKKSDKSTREKSENSNSRENKIFIQPTIEYDPKLQSLLDLIDDNIIKFPANSPARIELMKKKEELIEKYKNNIKKTNNNSSKKNKQSKKKKGNKNSKNKNKNKKSKKKKEQNNTNYYNNNSNNNGQNDYENNYDNENGNENEYNNDNYYENNSENNK